MATATSPNGRATDLILPAIKQETVKVSIRGLSTYISGNFSQKARNIMAEKQQKKAVGAREAKNPQEQFQGSMYVVPGHEDDPVETQGRYYIPGRAFKNALIDAAPYTAKTVPKTKARGAIFVLGDPVIDFSSVAMREDAVRNATGVADLRYRAEFHDWTAELAINFDASTLSLDQVLNLLVRAGWHIGVGELRPQKSAGDHGRWEVVSAESIASRA